jgi:hypothetical protein
MKMIDTTATVVRRLKQRARSLSKTQKTPLHEALEIVAREAGYDDWHHVTAMLELRQRGGSTSEGGSAKDMEHPGQRIYSWLKTYHNEAWSTQSALAWRAVQPFIPIDWPQQNPVIERSVSDALRGYMVCERFIEIDDEEIRVLNLALQDKRVGLTANQKEHLKRLDGSTLRPCQVTNIRVDGTVEMRDLLARSQEIIEVAPHYSRGLSPGFEYIARVQTRLKPAWAEPPFLLIPPLMSTDILRAAASAIKNPPAAWWESISPVLIGAWAEMCCGGTNTNWRFFPQGETPLLKTLEYDVLDYEYLMTALSKNPEAEMRALHLFSRRGSDGSGNRYISAHVNLAARTHTVELTTETASFALPARGWFEELAKHSVKYLRAILY